MKKIICFFILGFLFNSCSLGNDEEKYSFELLPIESVEMPTVYAVGTVSEIKIKYKRPTTCYFYKEIYYAIDQYTRTVAIEAVVMDQNNCLPDNTTLFEVPLNFKPTTTGTYTFKFWLGKNSEGVDQFLVHEVDVL